MNTYQETETILIEESQREKRNTVLFISLLSIFMVVLSYFVFSHQSLRLDESQSLWQTSRSPLAMIKIIAEDVHVPLYHLLLHFWQFLFGNAVVMSRTLSLVFAVASIPAIYFLGKISYNRFVGLFAALLLAISPFFNWYGNEIRMYALFAFLTILNQFFFIRIFKSEEGEQLAGIWWGYGITVIFGMFTHYFFGLALITQILFFVFYRRIFPKNAFKRFFGIGLILVILFIPWIWFVIESGGSANSQPALTSPTTVNLFNTFSQFIFGFQNDHLNTIFVSLWPLSVLLVFLSLRKTERVYPETLYFLLSVFVPVIIAFAVSTTFQPIFLTRYLILTLPSLYLVISWMLSIYPERLSRILKVALVIIMLTTLTIEAISATTPVKENYRGAANYLEEHANAQDVIVVSAPFTVYPILYYYRGPAYIETLPQWNRYITGPIPSFNAETLPTEVEKIKGDHQNLWLLLSYDQGYEDDLKLYFDSNYEKIDEQNFSPGLNLYGYKLRYDDVFLSPIKPDEEIPASSSIDVL